MKDVVFNSMYLLCVNNSSVWNLLKIDHTISFIVFRANFVFYSKSMYTTLSHKCAKFFKLTKLLISQKSLFYDYHKLNKRIA